MRQCIASPQAVAEPSRCSSPSDICKSSKVHPKAHSSTTYSSDKPSPKTPPGKAATPQPQKPNPVSTLFRQSQPKPNFRPRQTRKEKHKPAKYAARQCSGSSPSQPRNRSPPEPAETKSPATASTV